MKNNPADMDSAQILALPQAAENLLLWQENAWPRFLEIEGATYEVGEYEGSLCKRLVTRYD